MGKKEPVFKTKITDGERSAYGSGATAKESQKAAKRNWDKKRGKTDD